MSYDAAPSSSCRLGSYALGLLFIFLVSCSWAGASVLLQYIYQDLAFDSPFIITYVCTSLFAVYLPWVYACGRLGIGQNPPFYDDPDSLPIAEAASLSSSAPSLSLSRAEASRGGALPLDHQPLKGPTSDEPDHVRAPGVLASLPAHTSPHQSYAVVCASCVQQERPAHRWSHTRTMRVARVICPLWFVANFTYNLSLAMTSVTSNTIISTTSSLWTFIFRCRTTNQEEGGGLRAESEPS